MGVIKNLVAALVDRAYRRDPRERLQAEYLILIIGLGSDY